MKRAERCLTTVSLPIFTFSTSVQSCRRVSAKGEFEPLTGAFTCMSLVSDLIAGRKASPHRQVHGSPRSRISVAKALECIHSFPATNWTIETLAHEAGLSRSLFAKQFHEAVGETPHLYLTRWRLGIADQLLSQTEISVGELAMKIGYNSEYSFARAFKQSRGTTPNQHRLARRKAEISQGEACGLTGQLLADL